MFEQFRTVDEGSLQEDRALENHAMLVMNALDEAMANLDDEEYLVDMLLVTGKSHRRFEDFNESIFWVCTKCWIDAGLPSQTVAQHQSNTGSTSRARAGLMRTSSKHKSYCSNVGLMPGNIIQVGLTLNLHCVNGVGLLGETQI